MAYTTLPIAYLNGDTFSASDINNTNTVINALSNNTNFVNITTKGDILTGSATANALVKTAVGSNNTVLYANSAATGGVSWGLITSAMITDGTIVAGDIFGNTITSAQCLASGATTSIVSIGTALASATSSKIHFKATAGAPTTGGAIGDIWFVMA